MMHSLAAAAYAAAFFLDEAEGNLYDSSGINKTFFSCTHLLHM